MAERIGFVGLGIMGKPMAKNLLKAGYSLTVYDIVGEPVEELVTDGAARASSNKEVAANSDKIFTMLPDSADSEIAILGPEGVLEGAASGSIIIDMSSIAPLVSKKIAAECAQKGVEMLDAPVSGGEPGAINAALAIMVGGKQEVFDGCFDLLKTMGSNVVLTGDIGAGGVTKLANQIIVAANIEALSEALVLAQKAGVDPEKVFNAIRGGLAGSAVMEAKGPMMLDRNFTAGFRIRLHQKDLRNVLQTGQELNVPLPVTALIQQMLGALINEGESEADHAAILHFLEGMAKVEVKRGG
ncbi:MAG: 2-hydroxy-3-oxopropionate reductase [Chloroflexi bacterium]|nr:2-hydroxy-3-oxopropionate reductase [Chloroflexota bacterium]MCH8349302.1 2-hydroxy-3-oxopropionate reductase [Chloroflexota bacterium]MCI0780276.1 2-hydroxy-3-oxopropionate reductase [Chloroflexota bacterium]MCI0787598.1 2-hydroxy-3-oxopropionate reductase [Chloroflexota bacterium]MCI0794770.1 2-hydroxy-3-oxopropionate reductase [Chloroflexota bacterium]